MKSKNIVLIALALLFAASPAFAASTAGDVAKNLFEQFRDFGDVITAGIFLAGLGIGGAAALKFKAHSENAQQVPLKIPMIYAIVAAICIGFVAFLQIGKDTMFGDGSEANSLDQSVYSKID